MEDDAYGFCPLTKSQCQPGCMWYRPDSKACAISVLAMYIEDIASAANTYHQIHI